MTNNYTYKRIVLAVVGLLAMPVFAMAFSGTPKITLEGVSDVGNTYATVTIFYDSNGSVYRNSEEPMIHIEYTDTTTGETLITPFGTASQGSRPYSFGIFNLERDTTYSYRAIMKYDGKIVQTGSQRFTTKGAVTVKEPKTNTTTTGTKTTTSTTTSGSIGTIPGVQPVVDASSKVATGAKSTVMTGGATHKNGVALAITDEQARTSVGDTFTYTISFLNSNKESLKNAELVVKLPEQYEFVKSSFDMEYNEHDNTVSYVVGRVPNGTVKKVTFIARAIGDGKGEVRTTATLYYEGGTISASDRDHFNGGSKSVLGASVFGAGFFPQTLLGWIAIVILIAVIIIVARRYMVAK